MTSPSFTPPNTSDESGYTHSQYSFLLHYKNIQAFNNGDSLHSSNMQKMTFGERTLYHTGGNVFAIEYRDESLRNADLATFTRENLKKDEQGNEFPKVKGEFEMGGKFYLFTGIWKYPTDLIDSQNGIYKSMILDAQKYSQMQQVVDTTRAQVWKFIEAAE